MFTLAKSDKSAVDLTGTTVNFYFRVVGSGTLKNTGHTLCTITSYIGGICTYTWSATDLDTAGEFEGELEVTYGDTTTQTVYKVFEFHIRAEFPET
jgi:hypothetical protein